MNPQLYCNSPPAIDDFQFTDILPSVPTNEQANKQTNKFFIPLPVNPAGQRKDLCMSLHPAIDFA